MRNAWCINCVKTDDAYIFMDNKLDGYLNKMNTTTKLNKKKLHLPENSKENIEELNIINYPYTNREKKIFSKLIKEEKPKNGYYKFKFKNHSKKIIRSIKKNDQSNDSDQYLKTSHFELGNKCLYKNLNTFSSCSNNDRSSTNPNRISSNIKVSITKLDSFRKDSSSNDYLLKSYKNSSTNQTRVPKKIINNTFFSNSTTIYHKKKKIIKNVKPILYNKTVMLNKSTNIYTESKNDTENYTNLKKLPFKIKRNATLKNEPNFKLSFNKFKINRNQQAKLKSLLKSKIKDSFKSSFNELERSLFTSKKITNKNNKLLSAQTRKNYDIGNFDLTLENIKNIEISIFYSKLFPEKVETNQKCLSNI